MNAARAFPIAIIALSACAGVVYFITGDWRKGVYWTAAAVIGISVTF